MTGIRHRARLVTTVAAALAVSTPYGTLIADDPPEVTETQRFAGERLIEMAQFVAGLDGFSVEMRAGYDVLQESGQMIQFVENRQVLLQRPNRLLIKEETAGNVSNMLLFDGDALTVWQPTIGVYAQTAQPGSVDDTIVYFERDLGMRIPLATLLTTRMPAELQRHVNDIDYVELTDLQGKPVHHIAARTAVVDFQAWIADGPEPLPLRVVLTYPDEGRPQYWADFTDWNLQPDVDAAAFDFVAPADAQKIPFAVQLDAFSADSDPAVE